MNSGAHRWHRSYSGRLLELPSARRGALATRPGGRDSPPLPAPPLPGAHVVRARRRLRLGHRIAAVTVAAALSPAPGRAAPRCAGRARSGSSRRPARACTSASCFWRRSRHRQAPDHRREDRRVRAARPGTTPLPAPRRRRPLPRRVRRLGRRGERLGLAPVPRARDRVLRQAARPARGVVPRHPGLRRRSSAGALAVGVAGDRARSDAPADRLVATVAGAIGVILDASIFAYLRIVLAVIVAADGRPARRDAHAPAGARARASRSPSPAACSCCAPGT